MKLRTGWKHSLLPSLCSENKYFAIAIKNFDKAGIKVFCFCPILPDISLFSLAASHSKKCFFRSEIFLTFTKLGLECFMSTLLSLLLTLNIYDT